MRKLLCLGLALLIVKIPSGLTQAAAVTGVVPALQVGVAAAVKGAVQLTRSGQAGLVVESGMPVMLGDEIKTDEKGRLQVMLMDETIFTIGPNSAMVIDEFVYDPATNAGKVEARVVKGVFRFVTGKVAHKNPKNMEVKLPNGTIGIRGTIVQGRTGGGNSLAVLMGPGERNNAGLPAGGMTMESGGKTQDIFTTGFGSQINGDNPPTPAFKVPEDTINQMNSDLNPSAGSNESDSGSGGSAGGGNDSGGDGAGDDDATGDDSNTDDTGMKDSASDSAGQTQADWGDLAGDVDSFKDAMDALEKSATESAQDNGDELTEEAFGVPSGLTTYEQMRFESGKSHYIDSGNTLYDSGSNDVGSYDIYYEVDFGNRIAGTGSTRVTGEIKNGVSTPQTFEFANGSQQFQVNFASLSGNASIEYLNLANAASGTTCGAGCGSNDLDINFVNAGGETASIMSHNFQVTNNNSGVVTGEGDGVADRSDGPLV